MAFLPTTRPQVELWLQRFHEAADSLDVDMLPAVYTRDAKVQFGNMPVMEGIDGFRPFFEAIWPRLARMKHNTDTFDMVGNDKIYMACHITWEVKYDPEEEKINVPAFGVFHLVGEGSEKGLVRAAEFYMDSSPLTEALKRAPT